ncbi:MAG: tetratricopeptide repeat protein, partial [Phycisphaerae bacterium]
MKRPVRRGAFFALPIVVAGLFFSPLPAHAQETPHPLNADAYFARGTTAHQLGDLQTAIDLFRRAVAKQPGELRFGLKLAATLMEAEQFDQAEHLLGIMKEQHPRSVDVSSLLGRVFARSGNW